MLINCENLNLHQVANSGQCFRWKEIKPNHFEIPIKSRYVNCWQIEPGIISVQEGIVPITDIRKYFDLETDYQQIINQIPVNDTYLRTAAEKFSGIRILQQDLWEIVVSFIISQNNNIPRIKKTIDFLCENSKGFPDANSLNGLLHNKCFGYRSTYLADAIDYWLSFRSESAEHNLKSMTYEEAKAELKTIKGIGDKVADCICLFGLHHLEACPVDTWMKKIINERYGGIEPNWMKSPHAGVYQQYAFEYERSLSHG